MALASTRGGGAPGRDLGCWGLAQAWPAFKPRAREGAHSHLAARIGCRGSAELRVQKAFHCSAAGAIYSGLRLGLYTSSCSSPCPSPCSLHSAELGALGVWLGVGGGSRAGGPDQAVQDGRAGMAGRWKLVRLGPGCA